MGDEMFSINSAESDSHEFDLRRNENSPYPPPKVDQIRRHLRFFFMTPCEKYQARRRKPWKLIVQFLKIIIVTIQVFSLANERTNFVNYQDKTKLALEHILFNKWDPAYETLPYPPATGEYALYKYSELVDHINYAMEMYNKTVEVAIGAYGYPEAQSQLKSKYAHLKLTYFRRGDIFPNNFTYKLNPNLDNVFFNLTAVRKDNGTEEYDVVEFLRQHGYHFTVQKLHSIELSFALDGIHINAHSALSSFTDPDCLNINATAIYDNNDHDGQILVRMKIDLDPLKCNDGSSYDGTLNSTTQTSLMLVLDICVMVFCCISLVTCLRSIKKALHLLQLSKRFFKKHFNYKLKGEDIMLFISLWFVMIVVSDVLTIIGTAFKMSLYQREFEYYDTATMLLGIAIILIWMGVMRYFEYFKKYNVLVLTCKKALPDVLRFLICASIFYIAFTICGWLVLGPYHVKFATIATSSECLFSLVNGDDMFVTFSVINQKAPLAIWYFSRFYLYSFISLFIYFVLNLFISVIIDTYDVVKKHYKNDMPQTVVEKFIASCEDAPDSPLYISDVQHRRCCCRFSTCCMCPFCDRWVDEDMDLLA
ncbi:mucolipin-3-like isoform X1 [Watersipora subatra]|uniref:mucolipin-3-like isoform X1 n=1 Tax=Watersipora subatra TaxID=2589382 RepID=UPI00355C56F1